MSGLRVRSVRTRLLLAVLGAVVLAVAAMTAGFNLLLARSLSHNASDLARTRATAQLTALQPTANTIDPGDIPDQAGGESQFWVFSRGKTLRAPRGSKAVADAARSLAGGGSRFLDVSDADVRLYAMPAVFEGKRLGTVVAGVSLAPYEQTRRTALIGSLALALLLALVVALAARWVLAAAFRPVERMTHEAADWSEHQLDRRFELGEPHDELTRLAATLDSLLNRIAASLRREQRFSAELSHELRTPVARIAAEADLALRRERSASDYRAALEVVLRNAKEVASTIEALVSAAQQEAGLAHGTADAYEAAAKAAELCDHAAAERGVSLAVERPRSPLRVGVDRELAVRTLQPVVENAIRYGHRRVRVSLDGGSKRVTFLIEDDGPGVAGSEHERIFEAGVRGAAARNGAGDGAGLGLPLARRLARAAAGDVESLPSASGARFAVSLPTA
ncbi:MAG: HAMP domain-containing protein [Actinobacteria bacterium]|nr:MAG: HAMP domain-containing protein [Actinomycetota bacterium]